MGIAAMIFVLAQLAAPPMPAPKLPAATAAHGAQIDDRSTRQSHRHQAAARYFSITDGVTSGITFAILDSPQQAISAANRVTLAPNGNGSYRCGGATCYVAFSVRGGLQARIVTRGQAYRFQYVGNTFDLYAIG